MAIGIIDFGAGNAGSVKKAFDYVGARAKIIQTPQEVESSKYLILPGVGNFGSVMTALKLKKLDQAIIQAINEKKPLLGICVGLQVLFEKSEESPGVKGLCLVKGKVVKFRKGKVPQIGWNKIEPLKEEVSGGFAYFVNSYYAVPEGEDRETIAAVTDYNGRFASVIKKGSITAAQFHPEKSGEYGIRFLERWLKCSQKE